MKIWTLMVYRIIAGTIVAGVALVAIAQNARVPIDFRGRWASSEAQCGVPHEGSLTISEDRIDFYESRGKGFRSLKPAPCKWKSRLSRLATGKHGGTYGDL